VTALPVSVAFCLEINIVVASLTGIKSIGSGTQVPAVKSINFAQCHGKHLNQREHLVRRI
jgi:hypothetical protein